MLLTVHALIFSPSVPPFLPHPLSIPLLITYKYIKTATYNGNVSELWMIGSMLTSLWCQILLFTIAPRMTFTQWTYGKPTAMNE